MDEVIEKMPEQFEVGDVVLKNRGIPYTDSPMVKVEPRENGQTYVEFENGEQVTFMNGYVHPIKG